MTEVGPYFAWPSANFANEVWTREHARNSWAAPVALVLVILIVAVIEQLAWDAGWVKPSGRTRLAGEYDIVCIQPRGGCDIVVEQ